MPRRPRTDRAHTKGGSYNRGQLPSHVTVLAEPLAEELINKAIVVQKAASRDGNVQLLDLAYNLILDILLTQDLLRAFQASESKRPSDVARRLDLTRPGLFVRLERLGLSTDDFHHQSTVCALLRTSESVSKLVKDIETAYNRLLKTEDDSLHWFRNTFDRFPPDLKRR